MRMKRLNKRAEEDESLHTILGLVMLAIVLITLVTITVKNGDEIMSFLRNVFTKGLLKIVNAESLYTRASESNFKRLNEEITNLLDTNKDTDHIVIPYTLGQLRLVGFNKDPINGFNEECLGEDMAEQRPDECKNTACLCLCYKDVECNCETYPEIDYFITTHNQFRNKGNLIGRFSDPLTGEPVRCLMIKGAANEEEKLGKIIEPYNNWWRSNMVYLEKTEKNGKRYLFFSRVQDVEYTDRMNFECDSADFITQNCGTIKSCTDYKGAELGCDWRYACQNNACAGSGLNCNVVKNPYATTEDEEWLCMGENEDMSEFCIPGPEEYAVPYSGRKGDLVWLEESGLCFRCVGLGLIEDGADNWGWGQDPTIDKENCVTPQ